jgi:phenylacetate-CoA ligase
MVNVSDENHANQKDLVGELICTGLLNSDMPLIRYCVGDRGALPTKNGFCECGRTLPMITSIDGRCDDMLYTFDGRSVGRLDPVFKGRLPIREAQIIQEALDLVRVRFIPAPGYSAAGGQSVIDRLRERLGPIEVILEQVDYIPRTSNGKFRAVICNLPKGNQQSAGLVKT